MADVVYRCPGTARQELTLDVGITHLDGCCARFALMSATRRAEIGLAHVGTRTESREELPRPPGPPVLTVPQLAREIETLQRRAAQFPDEEPPGATLWVEYGPEHTLQDVLALYDLGQPYNLVLGYRRILTDLEEGDSR